MRGTFRWLSLLVLLASCNRTEEPKTLSQSATLAVTGESSTAKAHAPEASAIRPSEPAASADLPAKAQELKPAAPAPCVVPLSEVPNAVASPAKTCPKSEGNAPTLSRTWLSFPEAKGTPRISVEVAKTPSEHARGLMYRTQMPSNHGMIFQWPDSARRVFWMRNTCLPLDMLFIAEDMTIAGILEQVPVLNEEPRTVPCPAAYVLEVNAGWTRRHGIKPGTKIAIE